MNFYKKDRFRHRKYFDSFSMNRDQTFIINHYIYAHYSAAECFDTKWFEFLNKLIYRVARFVWLEPSKVSAGVICEWLYLTMNRRCHRLTVAETKGEK